MSRIAAPLDRRHSRAVMVTRKRLALALFLLWEAYWAYAFFSAPVPDEKMDTVFALLMGVFLPLAAVAAAALLMLAVRLGRRKS